RDKHRFPVSRIQQTDTRLRGSRNQETNPSVPGKRGQDFAMHGLRHKCRRLQASNIWHPSHCGTTWEHERTNDSRGCMQNCFTNQLIFSK
ncbi:hypothetical protein CSKR_200305, partial [Clonorchis sinensis]